MLWPGHTGNMSDGGVPGPASPRKAKTARRGVVQARPVHVSPRACRSLDAPGTLLAATPDTGKGD